MNNQRPVPPQPAEAEIEIQIKLLNEPPAVPPVVPVKPEAPRSGVDVVGLAQQAGHTAVTALTQITTAVWRSELRQQVGQKITTHTGQALRQGKTVAKKQVDKLVNEKLAEEKERLTNKVKETDWRDVASRTAAQGARQLSNALSHLANRLNTPPSPPNAPPPAPTTPPADKNTS